MLKDVIRISTTGLQRVNSPVLTTEVVPVFSDTGCYLWTQFYFDK
jgi:hypothetical protein